MSQNNELWLDFAKNALDWFIETIGELEWHRRRKNVVDYFHAIKAKELQESDVQTKDFQKQFDPVAVYSDWMAWYMYLIESTFERPFCNDPFQWTRIYPFFAAIGKNLEALKRMSGIEQRLKFMLNENQNQPDSSLFELTVAILYYRNGWSVTFLEENKTGKTPDLKVSKNNLKYWVECKRLAKVTEYAETERQEWQKRSRHLFNAMRIEKIPLYAQITFKIPVEETNEMILGKALTAYVRAGKLGSGEIFGNEQIEFCATQLDISSINKRLADNPTRPNSPQMIEILAGNYNIHGNYTPLLAPSRIDTVGGEDELFVLNEFYGELHWACIAQWDCIAKTSVDRKAKDIKKTLSNALKQIPEVGRGIIHIGYETVVGPIVELERHKKINETVQSFGFGNKEIESIFCNTMQFLPTPEGFECAETTIYFERAKNAVLFNNLLFDLPVTATPDVTHWEEDIAKRD
ncbi:MAG TPA: hypothetical protein VN721_16330 [Flavipsychrobacter sp.]|nr:hypothetical protein [Flavipsychrobacter sp.]